jgi:hypothetical protein
VEEVSAQVEEVTASAQSLAAMAQELEALVAQFKLPDVRAYAATPRATLAPVTSDGGDGQERAELKSFTEHVA